MRFEGFCGPSYTSQSLNAECQTCLNLYPEAIETKSGYYAMYPTPGKRLAYDLGPIGPIRGLYTLNGRTYVVSGTNFMELKADGTSQFRGTVVSDGGPVSMAGGPTQVLIASALSAYVYNTTDNSFTPIPDQITDVLQVGYTDGFFFALLKSGKIQSTSVTSGIDALVWPGDSAILVEVFTDTPNAIFFDHREMWVFGPKAIQPYVDAGDVPFPFDVIQGAFIESGLAAPFSVAKLDNSIFWLGSDERGQGVVRRANGYQAVRVSNHAVEFAIQGYGKISDAIAYGYQDQGHEFYVLSFPTANKTWVYDAATGMWHERGFWNSQAGVFTMNRALYHTFNFGMHLVGDPTAGKVYEQDISILDDNGSEIRRVRRAPHISNEQNMTSYNRLQIYLETGLATFDGPRPPTRYVLESSGGILWSVTVNDVGVVKATKVTSGEPQLLRFSASTGTIWDVTVTDLGILRPVELIIGDYDPITQFVSTSGTLLFNMQVRDIAGNGQIQTIPIGKCTRGPNLMLRSSKDGAHTWGNVQTVDCGQLGNYRARAMFRRLGTSRDRVFEISMSDPVPWRFCDAYLEVG